MDGARWMLCFRTTIAKLPLSSLLDRPRRRESADLDPRAVDARE